MVRLLTGINPAAWLLLCFIIAGLAIGPAFLLKESGQAGAGRFLWFPDNLFPGDTGLYRHAVYLLSITGAAFLNMAVSNIRYMSHANLLPAATYIILYSILNPSGAFDPALIVNLLLVFIMLRMHALYKEKKPYPHLFDAGLITGIAFLVMPVTGIFLIYLFLSIFLFRVFNWREWAVAFCGFATPVFLYGVYMFWNGIPIILSVASTGVISKSAWQTLRPSDYLAWGYLAVLLAISVFFIMKQYRRSVVKTRDHHLMFIWMLFFCIFIFLAVPGTDVIPASILCVPASCLLAYYFYEEKNRGLKEAFFLILTLAALAQQYLKGITDIGFGIR